MFPLLVSLSVSALLAPSGPPGGKRAIGTLRVSELGLGTLNLPLDKKAEDPDTAAALKAAIASGCNFVDTAEAYGIGNSERLTAWAAKEAGIAIGCDEGQLHVATKFAPVPWRTDAESVVEACRASAERLGVSQVPLSQIHWPDIIQPFKAFGLEKRKDELYWEGLARCYELGLAANVGVCVRACCHRTRGACDARATEQRRNCVVRRGALCFAKPRSHADALRPRPRRTMAQR